MVQLVCQPFHLRAVSGNQLALAFVTGICKIGGKTTFLKGRMKKNEEV